MRITPGSKASFIVNDKDVHDYFQTSELLGIVNDAFTKSEIKINML